MRFKLVFHDPSDIPDTGQCPATQNVRLDGFDLLADGCNNKQPDAGACCNQCRGNLACVAWTYNHNGSLPCARTYCSDTALQGMLTTQRGAT